MEIKLSQNDYEVKRDPKKPSKIKQYFHKMSQFAQINGGWPFILGFCIVIYFGLGLILNSDSQGDIIQWGGNIIPIAPIEFFRFINSIFLHAGFFHLFFNMISVYYLAQILDKVWDGTKTFIVFIATGLLANVLEFYTRSFFSSGVTLSIGASGGVFGLMGALLGYYYFNKHLSKTLKIFYSQRILSLFVLNILINLLVPNIDFLVHIFGFLIGVGIGLLIEKLPYSFYKQHQGVWFIIWFLILIFILYSFIDASIHYWRSF
jgi:rhomboid protease GluP